MDPALSVALVEPYFSGSHKQWAEGYQHHSKLPVRLLTLPGRHWKWRMAAGAPPLARQLLDDNLPTPDVILASSMLDLPSFLGLTRHHTYSSRVVLYMHENQLTYPLQKDTTFDRQYAIINFRSMIAADQVWFNSEFHRDDFFQALESFLSVFPAPQLKSFVEPTFKKSMVMPVGMDYQMLAQAAPFPKKHPVILWNHRWEHDKNPQAFFQTLFRLHDENIPFQLVVLGQKYAYTPHIFTEAQKRLSNQILHFGFVESPHDYGRWVQTADIVPITSNQEFFGISLMEALRCGVTPLVPNRLVYPEQLPKDASSFIYSCDNDLYDKLKQLLTEWPVGQRDFSQHAEQFSWEYIAPRYDQALRALVH